MSKKTFETYLQEAQQLRQASIAAETTLLLFLVEFEAAGVWRDAGFNTFASLIRQYKLTRPERLEEFKVGRGKLDDDSIVNAIGASATIQAGKIRDDKTRGSYVDEAKLRVRDDGFPWSEEQAERARMRVSPDVAKPLMRVARESRIEKELAEAEAVIATLREENRTLKDENKALRKLVGKNRAA